jgi:hypothetical protein
MKSTSVHHPLATPSLPGLLQVWVEAGLITPEQSEAIRRHEAGPYERRGALTLAPPAPDGPSLVVEALGYLGGVVMAVGALILVGMWWTDLSVALRLVLVGVTALALVGAGLALPGRLGEAAGRLRAALWAVAVLASGGFFAVLATDALHQDGEDALIITGPATALVAGMLWWMHRTWLNQLALFVAVVLSAVAVGLQISGSDSEVPGATVWVVAVAWAAVAWTGRIEPRITGVAFGALGAVFGALFMTGDLGIALALLTAVATVALALWERSLPWLGVGAIAMLYASPRAAVEWFPGPLSAALTLMVTGGALVGAAVWVARHRDGQPPS